jgi:protein-L-isoaspartate(D-aspartate) O-methyltransferase
MIQQDRIEAQRSFFARLITAKAGVAADSALCAAFTSTPRERFVGPPPWKIFTRTGYIEAPSDDPGLLYQDVVVSLGTEGPLNNGEPSLHAFCLATLNVQKGEKVVHVGAGTGYYTTILAKLAGEAGSVDAYEVEPSLIPRAVENLRELSQVTVHGKSGAEGPLPLCDVLYVNAGATSPMPAWLDALNPAGRLLFPLTPDEGAGAMLLIVKLESAGYSARFLFPAQFVGCLGARTEDEGRRLTQAFREGKWATVRSLHRDGTPDSTCWFRGPGWWLSTEAARSLDSK